MKLTDQLRNEYQDINELNKLMDNMSKCIDQYSLKLTNDNNNNNKSKQLTEKMRSKTFSASSSYNKQSDTLVSTGNCVTRYSKLK